jgi:LacI family fructose operon transcriptional repressor
MAKTVEEISRETGFSITTVRLIINGQSDRYRISAKTKKQVEDYIAIHGYSLNHAARSLKLRRSETIGFVVPDLANVFFARLMAALEILCRKRNLLLLTVASHEDPELENRAIGSLLARGVDALVIAPCQPLTLPQLAKTETRIVVFDRDFSPSAYPTVVSDNYRGGLEMTRKMLAQKDAAPCYFLCGHAESPSIVDRIRGFRTACDEAQVADPDALVLKESEDSIAAGRRLMQGLVAAHASPPRAFMCSSLLVLEGALQELKVQAGRIDKDILIGTFDDHTMLDLLPNRVVSIRQDEAALASKVFARLIERAGDKDKAATATARDIVASALVCRNL